jgi:hypothetical protein
VPTTAGGVTAPAQSGQLIERDSKHWDALITAVGAKIE